MGKKEEKALQKESLKQKSLKEKPMQEKPQKVSLFRRLTMRTKRIDNSFIKIEKENPSKDSKPQTVQNNMSTDKSKKVKETKPPKIQNKKPNKETGKCDSKKSNKKILKPAKNTEKDNHCTITKAKTQDTDEESYNSPIEKEKLNSPTELEKEECSKQDDQNSKEQDLKSPVKTEKTIKFAVEPDFQILGASSKPDAKNNGRRPSTGILKNVKTVPITGDSETGTYIV